MSSKPSTRKLGSRRSWRCSRPIAVFRSMPVALRIAAHELDSGERVVFGSEGHAHVPVSLACSASMALPLFFSPVRIDGRHYLDGGLGHVAHLDVAEGLGASLAIVVNPLVPVTTAAGAVPTGHGARGSVRDKGLLWVFNQSMRIGARRSIAPIPVSRRPMQAAGGRLHRRSMSDPAMT